MCRTGATARNDVGAEKLPWDAANAGSKEACRLLAIIYGEGRGVKIDRVAAEAWAELAGETAAAGSLTDDQKATFNTRVLEKQKHPRW
jgi:TPR repeat protein